MAELNYVDPASASASDLAWELLKLLNATGKDQALCALTGIMTDTGRFSYQNVNPTCFIHAAETVEAGASRTLSRESSSKAAHFLRFALSSSCSRA